MSEEKKDSPVVNTAGERLHALIRGALGGIPYAGGIAAELFSIFIVSPYQRRLQRWIETVTEQLQSLESRLDIASLANDETFVSTLIQATQAAVRTHREEKILLLKRAVLASAGGVSIPADLQSTFVRYVDELTPVHFSLLGFIFANESELRGCGSYHALLSSFISRTNSRVSPDEFRLLCNDLEVRHLVRFSTAMEDVTSAYRPGGLLIRGRREDEAMLRVTDIGRELIQFMGVQPE